MKRIISFVFILFVAILMGVFIFKSEPGLNKNFENQKPISIKISHDKTIELINFKEFPIHLGLDLSGGSHIVYEADTTKIKPEEISSSLDALRDVIERRLNIFGVSEPVVQVQYSNFANAEEKLIVDLPGITDVEKAVEMIGQTPVLEFKIEAPIKEISKAIGVDAKTEQPQFLPTELTGRYLKKATLEFDDITRLPQIAVKFNEDGTKIFAEITKNNIGKMLAIYLDGFPISAPTIRSEIKNGEGVISGKFNIKDAKILVGRLNSGALPVPITLLSKQTIGATLGENAVKAGVFSGIIGFLAILLFLISFYRLMGLIGAISLSVFVLVMLTLFKIMSVTLTSAGIAGFIISIGVAVDANVLVFERIKEELRLGRAIADAILYGFNHAWFSIRDSNIAVILTSIILFYFSETLVQGFALILGTGILISMFSGMFLTRILLSVFNIFNNNKLLRFLFCSK